MVDQKPHASLEQKRMLMEALNNFLRWEREGRPPYRQQYYYDDYHNHIDRISADEYCFSIQTYDSPMGDRWWHGRFRTLNGGIDVELLQSDFGAF